MNISHNRSSKDAVGKQLLRVGKLEWSNLKANQAGIQGKVSRITVRAFALILGRGVNPAFQYQRVLGEIGHEHVHYGLEYRRNWGVVMVHVIMCCPLPWNGLGRCSVNSG